jgi:hypothetical protein
MRGASPQRPEVLGHWVPLGEALLCSATLGLRNNCLPLGHYRIPVGVCHPRQHLVRGFLDTRVGTMELARRLGRHLTQQITVSHVLYSMINQIRTHIMPPIFNHLRYLHHPRRSPGNVLKLRFRLDLDGFPTLSPPAIDADTASIVAFF